jgi:phage terminase small subunit
MSIHHQITEESVEASENEVAPMRKYLDRSAAECLEDGPFIDEVSEREVQTPNGMTLRQRRFVAAYLGACCGDAEAAIVEAGYPRDNRQRIQREARRVLALPSVQQAIARQFSKHMLTEEWAMSTLAELASANMANFLDSEGRVDLTKAAAMGALGQIREMETITDPDTNKVVKVKLKLHDRLQALIILLRVKGLLVNHTKVEGGIEHRVATHADMRKIFEDPEANEMIQKLADKLHPVKMLPGQMADGQELVENAPE